MEKIRVLFVCLGNICRSPLAEAVFNHKIKQAGLAEHFEVDSCGTGDYHIGEPPDPRTLANARKNGIAVDHFCRQITEDDLSYFDYILTMDNSNLQNVMSLEGADQHSHKISLLREFDPDGKGLEVPDPYFGGEEGFDLVYDILDRALDGFLDYVKQTHSVS
jgi:Protein-tyrosine-phosphatase